MYVEIIGALLSIIVSILVFYVKRAYADLDAIKKELTHHIIEDVKEYVPRREMQEFADRIRVDLQNFGNAINLKLQSIEENLRSRRSTDNH